MLLTKSQILEVLKGVIFFAKGDNIVNLGMIDDFETGEDEVKIRIVFPRLDDPAVKIVSNSATKAIQDAFGAHVQVNITPVSEKEKGRGPLAGVRNIIAVASGKGGVGKSTVAANLAVALARSGAMVGLVDADIYGPSVPMMFGVENEQPGVFEREGKPVIIPIEKYGIRLLSIGFFVDTDKALIWRGPMATSALNQLLRDAEWGILDYLVIDLPPGTGDIQLTLAQSYSITGAVIVTTPQKVAFADVIRAAAMFRQEKLTIPLLGLIENMAYFTPSDMPEKKYFIFGKGQGEEFAQRLGIPLLGQIPLVEAISEAGDKGSPIALDSDSPVTKSFDKVAAEIRRQIP
ncbi:MAG: Mrp/NBP35 family ATP-binding protein [Bacteroidales bacterium]